MISWHVDKFHNFLTLFVFIQFLNNLMASSRSFLVSMVLQDSGLLLKSIITCVTYHGYHFCIHGFPCFEWLAVQIWIFRKNLIKRTKSNSYSKQFYNCVKMVDRLCSPEWDEAHNASRERRLMMQGPSHHQGSCILGQYAEAWVHPLFYLGI
jgi:hypothetical protein